MPLGPELIECAVAVIGLVLCGVSVGSEALPELWPMGVGPPWETVGASPNVLPLQGV
jgi:hypothetical protein